MGKHQGEDVFELRGSLLLRATSAGLWFGGGRIIPWCEVASIYEAWQYREPFGNSFNTPDLVIAFHRRRALLAAPWWLWFTSLPLGRIEISRAPFVEPTSAVVARLELMRTYATRRTASPSE